MKGRGACVPLNVQGCFIRMMKGRGACVYHWML